MEDESRFYVGFYCGFRSTQPTVGIESFQGYLVLGFLSILSKKSRFGDRSYRGKS